MSKQAMIVNTADIPADRWSVSAYVITALGLAGIAAAIIFLAIGRVHLAELIALASWAVVLLPTAFANAHGQASASNSDGSLGSRDASFWGALAVFSFLWGCYVVKTWPLAYDADVVFSQSELRTGLWITLSMLQTVPRACRIWFTAPSAMQD